MRTRHFRRGAGWCMILCGLCLMIFTAVSCGKRQSDTEALFANLAAARDAELSADGALSEGQGAAAAADGREDTAWVMNLPEDAAPESAAEHVLTVTWKKEKQISYARTIWGDLNCFAYRIEGSEDGEQYRLLYESENAPYLREDLAVLEPGLYKSLRLIIRGGANLCELQLYEQNPWEALLSGTGDGGQNLPQPQLIKENDVQRVILSGLPQDIEAQFGGCDLEQVVDAEGIVQETIADMEVRVGFRLQFQGWTYETPAYSLTIPASEKDGSADGKAAAGNDSPKPEVVPALKEWRGGSGSFASEKQELSIGLEGAQPEETDCILKTLQRGFEEAGYHVNSGSPADPEAAQLLLSISEEKALGTEGYRIRIEENRIQLSAPTQLGLWWGTQTLCQMLESGVLPCGEIRDYPTYPVRGFEIDAARKAVPLKILYEIAQDMARVKLNELTLHLNDNEILAYTGKLDSIENAMTSYAAFRMESAITGPEQVPLQAQDFFYTAEDFAAFVKDCADMGITVVPELDMPAHSLAITRAFPELSIAAAYLRPDSVDELDVGKEETHALAERIWTEQLMETGAFADCPVLHIGGDEYYGIDDYYINFMNRLASALKTEPLSACNAPGITKEAMGSEQDRSRRVRAWASLGEIRGMGRVPGSLMELCLWSTLWADPQTLYRAGHDLINARSDLLYIVPGTGADRFDTERFEQAFEVCAYTMPDGSEQILPAWSPQLRGAQFTLWNDTASTDLGAAEEDMLARFREACGPFAGKIW